jgi:hypothetical protein
LQLAEVAEVALAPQLREAEVARGVVQPALLELRCSQTTVVAETVVPKAQVERLARQ